MNEVQTILEAIKRGYVVRIAPMRGESSEICGVSVTMFKTDIPSPAQYGVSCELDERQLQLVVSKIPSVWQPQ